MSDMGQWVEDKCRANHGTAALVPPDLARSKAGGKSAADPSSCASASTKYGTAALVPPD